MSKSIQRCLEAVTMLGETGEIERIPAIADIYQSSKISDQWIVWGVDTDGAMLETIFAGPSAEERAIEYAEAKFAGLRRRESRPPQYQ